MVLGLNDRNELILHCNFKLNVLQAVVLRIFNLDIIFLSQEDFNNINNFSSSRCC